MLGHSSIPYLTRLWHPTTGCSHGCPTCWARSLVCDRLAGLMRGLPCGPAQGTDHLYAFDPTFHSDRLADPMKVRKPQIVGVSFLGDLFDARITDEQIAAVFGVMAAATRHTFIVLTKQAARLERWHAWSNFPPQSTAEEAAADHGAHIAGIVWDPRGSDIAHYSLVAGATTQSISNRRPWPGWPLPNVWTGVSVTTQAEADARIPHLLRTPAAHRWVSLEPLVGPVDLTRIPLLPPPVDELDPRADLNTLTGIVAGPDDRWPALDMVIAGGESGSSARPLDLDWMRSIRDQCAAAGVAFAFKQGSGMRPEQKPELDGVRHWDVPWMGGGA